MNQIDQIIAWENGELDDDETVKFFQEIINSGLAYKLQGCYARQTERLIQGGYCYPANVN